MRSKSKGYNNNNALTVSSRSRLKRIFTARIRQSKELDMDVEKYDIPANVLYSDNNQKQNADFSVSHNF